MKQEDQCVSLELAKKMKELGFKQDSLFYWIFQGKKDGEVYDFIVNLRELGNLHNNFKGCYPAYTVAELGEMLPLDVRVQVALVHAKEYEFTSFKVQKGWYCAYTCGIENILVDVEDKHEADARAKMLIYLAENNFIKLNQQ